MAHPPSSSNGLIKSEFSFSLAQSCLPNARLHLLPEAGAQRTL
jgi:hypothetical protein